ncbi:hypothetical protein [Piscinibacter sp.]|uniref:hypothetical protein n=1 Tax=Piscinibacter sp. TaxID=1903157 RepID=UPI002B534873|nr:hypothetical protein [Albitalea sp.]HUG26570.1 hypothetical protein [Albitalea sp.]
MANLWPWMAIAGLGAFHGLSPANGWMFAAAWGVREGGGAQALRALLPIAIGHAASVAVVAGALALGMALDRALVQRLAGALLVGAAAYRWLRGTGPHTSISAQAGHAGIALWSFLMATAHGAGLMLVPALVPLCLGDGPARKITASGSLVLALAAVGVHTAAMLITTGLIATGVCRGVAMHPRLLIGTAPRHAWTAALGATGVLLMALR